MKKYRTKKDLPGLGAGHEFTPKSNGLHVLNEYYLYEACPEWFEPIEDRIELKHQEGSYQTAIEREDGDGFPTSDLKLMEQARNGELFTKEDMEKFGERIFDLKGRNDVGYELDRYIRER